MRSSTAIVASACALGWLLTVSSQAQPPVPSEADTAVATEIERRLSSDHDVNAQTIKIDVRDGVATLTGTVTAPDAKGRAERLAAAVPGVANVRNQLTVAGTGVRGEGGPGPIPEEMPGAQ